MARARNIKPGFFANEDLVELSFGTRLLFIGLWTLADRAGRLEDRPKRIKMALFPADNIDIDVALDELRQSKFIIRYEANGERYIQVAAFEKHQNPHKDERVSVIPAPNMHDASTIQAQCLHGAKRADSPIPESLNLIPDAKPPAQNASAFARFWAAYPKKKSKGDAERAFKTIKPSEQDLEKYLQAISRAKTSAEWLREGGQFIPYPGSWLRDKGWEDEIAAPVVAGIDSSKPWFETAPGITAKAKENGIDQQDGEPFPRFRRRVFKALGWGPWVEADLRQSHRINPEDGARAEAFYDSIRPARAA